MFGRICLYGSILVVLVAAQDPPDTAPPVPPSPTTTQQTPPVDPENCKLNGYSPLGFVVKIWNKTAGNTTGHGSLISPIAILTSATNHDRDNATDYEAIGQNIWNRNTWESCMQVRTINHSIFHDKCCDADDSKFFNFLIFVLNEPFEVSTTVEYETLTFPFYPVLFLPLEPISTLLSIIQYNSGFSNVTNCRLPLFTELKEKKPAIMSEKDQEMDGLEYNKTCVPLMCEEEYRDESNGVSGEKCEETYHMRTYGTMMCVEPKDKSRKPKLPQDTKKSSEFYGGATLLCNNVAFGIVTEVFVRYFPAA